MSHIRTSRAGRLSALVAVGRPQPGHGRHGRQLRQHRVSAAGPAVVAQTATGQTLTSPSVARTASGRTVGGSFTPMHFFKRDGRVLVRGVIDGVVHKAGPDKKFSVIRTFKVKSMNGEPIRTARAAAPPRPPPPARSCTWCSARST